MILQKVNYELDAHCIKRISRIGVSKKIDRHQIMSDIFLDLENFTYHDSV